MEAFLKSRLSVCANYLLNRKRTQSSRLLTMVDIEREVDSFPDRAVHLAESLASQAAVAYENNQLYLNIQSLFEGLVKAAATAIEQRDPSTSGHSERVAVMTVGLAEAVNRTHTGCYAHLHFTPAQMKEIRYAALLHDFGKIAVREEVLIKAKKLYPTQLSTIEQRFDFIHQQWETKRANQKLTGLLEAGPKSSVQFASIDEECNVKQAELKDYFQLILFVNETDVALEHHLNLLADISAKTYCGMDGIERALLTDDERVSLSVQYGSLNDKERQEIESHVIHSFNFVAQIPWTPDLRYIPSIVRSHHEKLNGTGYPYGLCGDNIPIQAKMMIICDIFDALCSADRPYKRAVPLTRAFEILEIAAKKNEIDSDLLRIFTENRIFGLISSLAKESVKQNDEPLYDSALNLLED